jgi:hypothetical protein
MYNNKQFRIKKFFMIFIFSIAALFLFSFIVMNLWNAILPAVIHVTAITFWQALGILILSKILFGGFGGRRWGGRRNHFMQERFANMTSEEKEKFKAQWKDRCNRWSRNAAPSKSPQTEETSETPSYNG